MSITGALSVLGGVLLNVCSFLLPGYFSFRSLESHSYIEPWFTYWVVYAMLSVLEHCFWFVLSRIPGFLLAKLALICWLQFSNAQVCAVHHQVEHCYWARSAGLYAVMPDPLFVLQGAQLVYRRLLLPALRQHQPAIDRYIEMGECSIRKQMSQLVCIHDAQLSMYPVLVLYHSYCRQGKH